MLIDICMKFREDSLRGFQVTERTRFVTDAQGKTMSPNPEGGRHNTVCHFGVRLLVPAMLFNLLLYFVCKQCRP